VGAISELVQTFLSAAELPAGRARPWQPVMRRGSAFGVRLYYVAAGVASWDGQRAALR
jgi:hypothetical protein